MATRKPRTPVVRETAAERRIGIRDLKASLSECVREVKAGGTIIVTEHGKPVARLIPEPATLRGRMLALAQAGVVQWNGGELAPRKPVGRVRGAKTLADLITEERDRR